MKEIKCRRIVTEDKPMGNGFITTHRECGGNMTVMSEPGERHPRMAFCEVCGRGVMWSVVEEWIKNANT